MTRALPGEADRQYRRNIGSIEDACSAHLGFATEVRSAYRPDPAPRSFFDALGLWVIGAVCLLAPAIVAAQISHAVRP